MNRYAIEVFYYLDGHPRRMGTGTEDASLTTIIEVLADLANTVKTNVHVTSILVSRIEDLEERTAS